MNFCDFKKQAPKESWRFGPDTSRKMRTPRYGAGQQGIPRGPERAVKRCPLCNKRLRLRAGYCVGGEFVSWELPDHKARETRPKSAKRKTRVTGRGK